MAPPSVVCHACLSSRLVPAASGALVCLDCGTQLASFVHEAADEFQAGTVAGMRRADQGSQRALTQLTGQTARARRERAVRGERAGAWEVARARAGLLGALLRAQVRAAAAAEPLGEGFG